MKFKSLTSTLLWLLIPALVITMLISLWVSNVELKGQVNKAFDRSLAGAIRSIEVNIKTQDGGLAMEQPFYMLEFFELTTRSTAYFRVATEDRLTEIGYTDLPTPDMPLETGKAVFYNQDYLGQPMRIAAIAIRPENGLLYNPDSRIIIQVAESMASREDFINQLIWQSIRKDFIVLCIFIILLSGGIIVSLRPLKKLSKEIKNRSFDNLLPIDEKELPKEIKPLVQAINLHLKRYLNKNITQQQFLDDASHQLRTPLSVLSMQVDYARKLAKTNEMEEVLTAIQQRLGNTIQLTNQLLALAKVRDAADKLTANVPRETIDICQLAAQVVSNLLPTARKKRLDYGQELPNHPIMINGIEWLVKEALNNIVSNAIKYCPSGSRITVSVLEEKTHIILQVEDNGPGMSPEDIALAGKRFRRGASGKEKYGSGLGLAIVQTIVEINLAKLEIFSKTNEKGLVVQLIFNKNPMDNPE
ncbi:sensor histidine kinase N-terminal domain-containing protein [Advenella sp. WQ 585]|uniref:histidine kinase n=2 Tax=Advenella mandrilli TaxID=2800330 RepID=A0ABS1EAZ5_9BURK|nr:sensor histidine kinase N-terminal domain-containing protein [Advenella mandrilli]